MKTLEQYKEIVESLAKKLEGVVVEEESGLLLIGAVDALNQAFGNVLHLTILNSQEPEELVKEKIEKSISWVVGNVSEVFERRYGKGKTLFGLESALKEEEVTNEVKE